MADSEKWISRLSFDDNDDDTPLPNSDISEWGTDPGKFIYPSHQFEFSLV
jgi:hypothetical protein